MWCPVHIWVGVMCWEHLDDWNHIFEVASSKVDDNVISGAWDGDGRWDEKKNLDLMIAMAPHQAWGHVASMGRCSRCWLDRIFNPRFCEIAICKLGFVSFIYSHTLWGNAFSDSNINPINSRLGYNTVNIFIIRHCYYVYVT